MCPEKATQSTSSASRSIDRCAAYWAASSSTRAPCRRAIAARRSTGQNSPVTLEAAVSTTSAWRGRRAVPAGRARRAASSRASASRVLPGTGRRTVSRRAPGQQRRVVLGGEDDHRGVAGQRPGQQVDRVGGAAGEDDDVVLAGADEAGDLVAGRLVVRAGHPREPAGAAVHARVGARRRLDGPRDPLEGRGGCRVVEVRVVDQVARQRGHQVGAHDGRQVDGRSPAGGGGPGRPAGATASGTARQRAGRRRPERWAAVDGGGGSSSVLSGW